MQGKNGIEGLVSPDGVWVEDEEKISEIASNYFKGLFQSATPDLRSIQKISDCITTGISDQMREELDQPYSRSEIEVAMKSLSPSKAPGNDGTHASFYQSYWKVVGEDTTRVCLQILNE